MSSLSDQVRVEPGHAAELGKRDPADKLGLKVDKAGGQALALKSTKRIAELQELLWAEGKRSLLVILQGMDASGKDGATRVLLTGVNPAGVKVVSFKAPTATELAHDFLWRIHAATPPRGSIGVFNRSQYEDVVTTQVLRLIDAAEAQSRCAAINAFEERMRDQGTTIVKIFLHLSKEEQRARLQDRIDRPEKHWKMELGDLETRKSWGTYQQLYADAIRRTSTDHAPWHVVPADRKWVRDVVIGELVVDALEAMNPIIPAAKPELKGLVVS